MSRHPVPPKATRLSTLLRTEGKATCGSHYAGRPGGWAVSTGSPQQPVSTEGRQSPEEAVDEAGRHTAHPEFERGFY